MAHNVSSWKFPAILALVLVLAEIAVAALLVYSAPHGTRWLGDTLNNPSDVAVYLSYLRQGAEGHLLLKNLYAIEPNAPRFDLVWTTLGLAARALPPIAVHEASRWIFTVVLVFAVYAAARGIARTHSEVALATFLAFACVTQGWIVSVYLTLTNGWTWNGSPIAPDVSTEFSIPPVLWGGAHIILSLALLLTSLRLTWRAYERGSMRDAWLGALAMGALLCFHPYFVPLFVIFFLCILASIARRLSLKRRVALLVPFFVCALPAIAIFVPLAFDPVFREHHLVTNVLSLSPPLVWLVTLAPFLVAFGWRVRNNVRIAAHERWVFAWICSACVALLFPFPWKRKLTEGLGMALVFATLPFWTAMWDKIRSIASVGARMNATLLFLFVTAFVPFHLLTSQLAWTGNTQSQKWFYRSTDLFAAWDFIRQKTSQDAVVVADDMWANLWTPAWTGRTVFVGHDHETPNDAAKQKIWTDFVADVDDPRLENDLLNTMHASTLLLTTVSSTARVAPLLETSWQPTFTAGEVTVYERKSGLAENLPGR